MVQTCDLYEASYYLLGGCELEAIEAIRLDGQLRCRLTVSGAGLGELQHSYLSGEAQANLFAFRRTYSQVAALVHKAKRRARKVLHDAGPDGAELPR